MMPMFVIAAIGASTNLLTSLAGTQAQHSRTRFGATCTAGVYLKSDGIEYAYSNSGTAEGTSLGSFIEVGESADFWVRCTLNAGTLDGANAGTGTWLALTTSRGWAIDDTTTGDGADTADIDLEIATDSGGSNIIDTQNYLLSAEQTI